MWISKYNANGNDFLIFHTFKKTNRSNLAKKLCNRHSGIGADGLAILLPNNKFAYEWDFYNSDGSSAKMCGNASRCVGHYAVNNNLAKKQHSFLSAAGEIKLKVNRNLVEINFGIIKLLKTNIKENNLNWVLLDSGVPHLVSFVDSINEIPATKNKILKNLREKYNANVNLAYIKNKNTINIATFERGVENITLACGTGMAACFYLALSQKKIDKTLKETILIPPSGDRLYFRIENNEILYKGEVKKIADIKI